jgi:hypothetical protein
VEFVFLFSGSSAVKSGCASSPMSCKS